MFNHSTIAVRWMTESMGQRSTDFVSSRCGRQKIPESKIDLRVMAVEAQMKMEGNWIRGLWERVAHDGRERWP